MNPDTIGCVWTGEFDLNTLRMDGEIFESGKKKLRIQKYTDTCGRGENGDLSFLLFFSKQYLVENFQGKFQKNSSVNLISEESH